MAKKFGKILLFAAAVGATAAAAYYYLQKKNNDSSYFDDEDDDYDDFSDDFNDDIDDDSRTYVPLNMGNSVSSEDDESKQDSFTPLNEQVAGTSEDIVEEQIEEFYDEADEIE